LIFSFPVLAPYFFLWSFVLWPYILGAYVPMCSNSTFCVHLVSLKRMLRHEGIRHKNKVCGLLVLVVIVLICSTWGRVIIITECHSVERPNTIFGKSTCFVHLNRVFEICLYCSGSISWMLKVLPAFLTIQSLQAAESCGIWKEYRLRHQEAVICGFYVVGQTDLMMA
jgi:uncharacterized membrane protein YqjE